MGLLMGSRGWQTVAPAPAFAPAIPCSLSVPVTAAASDLSPALFLQKVHPGELPVQAVLSRAMLGTAMLRQLQARRQVRAAWKEAPCSSGLGCTSKEP